jgi:hypothetical protein
MTTILATPISRLVLSEERTGCPIASVTFFDVALSRLCGLSIRSYLVAGLGAAPLVLESDSGGLRPRATLRLPWADIGVAPLGRRNSLPWRFEHRFGVPGKVASQIASIIVQNLFG